MNLGDQRAGGIKNGEAPSLCLCLHGFTDAMRAEHQGGPGRDIAQFFNEDGALCFEIVHHIGVVNNFMTHIDGPAKLGNGSFHNIDGPIDTCAKTTRFSQINFFYTHKLPLFV